MFDQPLIVRAPRIGRRCFSTGCFATMTAIAALMIAQRPALAGPTGGTVVDGSAGISQSGAVTNINQSSGKAIINWQGFSIGGNETVNFNQPDRSSITLNRVIGNETSVISGALNANGQVFIVNSAGVLFGKGAQVNVGGLVASTLDISNANFMAGNYTFAGSSSASIVNQGRIHAHGGGYVALLGNTVSNDGVIAARLGTVAMASGNKITLNFAGNSLVDVTIDEGTLNALVENKRAIRADGGQIIMTAKAADAVLSAQVNNSGIIQARTMAALTGGAGRQGATKTGSIKLFADGGTTNVSGRLDASAPKGGDGGFIETSGDHVKIAEGTEITTRAMNGKTGTWLVDPNDFTIAATGGDMTAADVARNLATTNFEIKTATMGTPGGSGDINVNQALSWSTDNTLTLSAERNININAPITATGTNAGLVMTYGGDYNILTKASFSGAVLDGNGIPIANQDTSGNVYGSITLSGAHAGLTINGQPYTLIQSMSDLQGISSPGRYALGQNLDASGMIYPKAVVATLNGTLAGLGHTISNLTITNTTSGANTGLIGTTTASSLIRDIGLTNVNVTGTKVGAASTGVGALVGQNFGNVSHAYSTGTVSGLAKVGGLIGLNGSSSSAVNTISDSFSTASVSGSSSSVGGLIGRAVNVDIYRSHATGNVTANANAGGLIGQAISVNVHDSYADNLPGTTVPSTVTGGSSAMGLGGLIGNLTSGTTNPGVIENSYANLNVNGGYQLGGLVGVLTTGGADFTIANSFAGGNVNGSQTVSLVSNAGIGGLVGNTNSSGNATIFIQKSFATGNVSFVNPDGTAAVFGDFAGGLVGLMSGKGVIDGSYAQGKVTGSTSGSGAGGLVGSVLDATSTITNSYAKGDVSGNLSVGGLVGANAGAISNSYATGNVTGSGNNVGGLVGSNAGTIAKSHADGNVLGEGANSSTGGIAGTNGGSIADSYFSGIVKGPPGMTGGIAGVNFNNSLGHKNPNAGNLSNNYYNIDKNPGLPITNTPPCCPPGEVNGGGGLTSEQFKDVQFYLNGTINQVLADRAAAAAAAAKAAAAEAAAAQAAAARAAAAAQTAQAASRAASTVASNAATSAATPPNPALSAAGTPATVSSVAANVGDNLKTIEDSVKAEDQRALRRVADAAKSRRGRAGGGAGLGATIPSIDVDGQHFDLQGGSKKDAPGQKP
jgi:filamentous hemagglutinin family protein